MIKSKNSIPKDLHSFLINNDIPVDNIEQYIEKSITEYKKDIINIVKASNLNEFLQIIESILCPKWMSIYGLLFSGYYDQLNWMFPYLDNYFDVVRELLTSENVYKKLDNILSSEFEISKEKKAAVKRLRKKFHDYKLSRNNRSLNETNDINKKISELSIKGKELRKGDEFYKNAHEVLHKTLELLSLRSSLAKLLGHNTYAHKFIKENSIHSYDELKSIFSDTIQRIGRSEEHLYNHIELESEITCRKERLSKFEDIVFKNNIVKTFKIKDVIKSAFNFIDQLLGTSTIECTEESLWSDNVRAYNVYDKSSGSLLGKVILDLFKFQDKTEGGGLEPIKVSYQGIKRPAVICITLNIEFDGAAFDTQVGYSDITLLMHEFGHAIHYLFSSSTYYLTGPQEENREMSEFFSKLMENLALSYQFYSVLSNVSGVERPISYSDFLSFSMSAKKLLFMWSTPNYRAGMLNFIMHDHESYNIDTVVNDVRSMYLKTSQTEIKDAELYDEIFSVFYFSSDLYMYIIGESYANILMESINQAITSGCELEKIGHLIRIELLEKMYLDDFKAMFNILTIKLSKLNS